MKLFDQISFEINTESNTLNSISVITALSAYHGIIKVLNFIFIYHIERVKAASAKEESTSGSLQK